MATNTKQTSAKLASKATKALQRDKTSAIGRQLAASIMSQSNKDR